MNQFLKKTKDFLIKNRKICFLFYSILLCSLININVYHNNYSNFLIFFWLFSIFCLLLVFKNDSIFFRIKTTFAKNNLLIILLSAVFILLPSMVRIANFDLTRIHGDDILTGYFSSHYDFKKDNFFVPMPQNKGNWVCQFPSVFFVLQKIFFNIFGENLLTIKLSIIPYVLFTSLMLFFFVNKFFNYKTALVSLVFYAFMAPSLYLETLGLEFISSAVIFLAYLYFEIKNNKDRSYFSSVLSGLFCGLCLLFYSASYIAIPLSLVFFVIKLFVKNKTLVLKQAFVSIVVFLVTVSPFFTNMYINKNFYLSGRAKQVNIINGSWSANANGTINGKKIIKILWENSINSFKSFYKDGLSGAGGYNFGSLAFFEEFTLYFFVFGLVTSLVLMFKKKEILLIIISILFSFIINMVLTMPPAPFHRFSVVFPLVAIILSMPFYLIFSFRKKLQILSLSFILPTLLIISYNNQLYFLKQTREEKNNSSLKLAEYILKNFPDRDIKIAAFPGFVLDRTFYFALKNNQNKKVLGVSSLTKKPINNSLPTIRTEYHDTFLENFNKNEKYLYIYIFPEVFNDKFTVLDNRGKVIKFTHDYSMFVN